MEQKDLINKYGIRKIRTAGHRTVNQACGSTTPAKINYNHNLPMWVTK